jgi:hypothetical protein
MLATRLPPKALLVSAGVLLASVPGSALAGSSQSASRSPAGTVPRNHLAYVALLRLELAGVPTLRVGQSRTLLRFEFARETRRDYATIQEGLTPLKRGKTIANLPQQKAIVRLALQSPEQRQEALMWCGLLTEEFEAELRAIEADPAEMNRALAQWAVAAPGRKVLVLAPGNPPPYRPSMTTEKDAGQTRGPFEDLPRDDWTYEAVTYLAKRGFFTGYPDGRFKGKRALTRYEFAVALQRLLTEVQRVASREDLIQAAASDIDTMYLLIRHFSSELAMLGADTEQIMRNLAVMRDRLRQP